MASALLRQVAEDETENGKFKAGVCADMATPPKTLPALEFARIYMALRLGSHNRNLLEEGFRQPPVGVMALEVGSYRWRLRLLYAFRLSVVPPGREPLRPNSLVPASATSPGLPVRAR